MDIASTGATFLRGTSEYTPNEAATRRSRAIPKTKPVPNLFLLAAAISTELLDSVRGGSADRSVGIDTCVGMRPEEEVTVELLPESISRWRRFRSARSSAETW